MTGPARGDAREHPETDVATGAHPAAPVDDAAARSAPRRLLASTLPPLVYAAIALHYFTNFVAHPSRGVPGGADGILYAWYFEWVEHSLVTLHNPLVSSYLNAPFGLNLMWNTSLLALAIVCAPLTSTIGPIATVGWLMVLAPVASASTCYFVLRRLTRSTLGPALVALIYGFGPFFVGQQGHLHLTVAIFPPLLLVFAYQLIVEQQRSPVRTGLWLGIVVGLQMLVSEEIVVLTAVIGMFSVLGLVRVYPGEFTVRRRHVGVGLGVGAIASLVVAGGPLAYQFFGPHALSGVGFKGQHLDLTGLVRPSALQYFASQADIRANSHFPANSVENTGYLGWPLLVLVLAIAGYYVKRRDRFGLWWLVTAGVTVVLSFGGEISVNGTDLFPGPWWALRELPLLGGVVPPRFSLFTTLLVTLILARWLAGLRGRVWALGMLVTAGAMVALLPAGPYGEISRVTVPRFFTGAAERVLPQGSTVFVMPYTADADATAQIMYWQIRSHLRFRLIGGYSVFEVNGEMSYHAVEPGFTHLLSDTGRHGVSPTSAQLAAARASVRSSRVDDIVITDGQQHAGVVARAAAQLTGCVPERVADVTLCAVPSAP